MSERSGDANRLTIEELFEALPVAIYEIDAEGRILFTNSAYASITGYSVDELSGMSVPELMAPGSDRDGFAAMLAQLVAETPDPFPYVTRNLNGDGQQVDVEIRWDYRRDDEGRVVGFVCSLNDVTDRVRAVNALRLSEERFRSVFHQSPWGMVLYAPDGRPQYVNPVQVAIMGLSEEEEAAAMKHYNILEDRQLAALGLAPIIERGFAGESLAIPAALYEPRKMQPPLDKEPLWLRGFIYPLRSGGEIRNVVVLFEDITEAKEAEERHAALEARLQQAQKMDSLSVLAGGIAHDFNNMLVAILGNADLALVDLPPDSPARVSLSDIVAGASRAADLVRQLLAYSGKSEVAKELLDLTVLVGDVGHLVGAAVSKKATLRFDLAPDLPSVEADATQLRQIVLNLIINASESLGADGGIITVRTGAMECDEADLSDNYILDDLPAGVYSFVEVEDTGRGMDPETRERLFEPFFTTKMTGRGLGLAAALGIVRGHHGAITVRSRPGEGTALRVLLPIAIGEPVPDRESGGPGEWRGEGTAMVVDDEPTVRAVAERMMRRLGFDVVVAGDGMEALDIIRGDPDRFVLVLLDLSMPRMDGAECFQELRRIRPELPVLICSGYLQDQLTDKFGDRSPDGFVQKPFRLGQLSEAIQAILE